MYLLITDKRDKQYFILDTDTKIGGQVWCTSIEDAIHEFLHGECIADHGYLAPELKDNFKNYITLCEIPSLDNINETHPELFL